MRVESGPSWGGGWVGAGEGVCLATLPPSPPEWPGRAPGSPARNAGSPGSPASCSASEASCLGVARTRKLRPAARDMAKVTRWPGFEPSSCLFREQSRRGRAEPRVPRRVLWRLGLSRSAYGPGSPRWTRFEGLHYPRLLQPGIASWVPLAWIRIHFRAGESLTYLYNATWPELRQPP